MDANEIVSAYGAAWNEPDEVKRAHLLERAWADDGVYQDPTATANGRTALLAHIAGFQATFPGHTIEQTSGLDVTDAGARFAWEMRNGDDVALEGLEGSGVPLLRRARRLHIVMGVQKNCWGTGRAGRFPVNRWMRTLQLE